MQVVHLGINDTSYRKKLTALKQHPPDTSPFKHNMYLITFVGNAALNKLCPNYIRFFFPNKAVLSYDLNLI